MTLLVALLLALLTPVSARADSGAQGYGTNDERSAEVNANVKRAKQRAAALDRQLKESEAGRAPQGHRPLTKAEIEALREARRAWQFFVERGCVPTLNDAGVRGTTAARELCNTTYPPQAPDTRTGQPAAPPPPPNPELLAAQAVLQLKVPEPAPNIGPPPSVNRWNAAVVGYPLWLWSTPAGTIERTATIEGITITMTARRTHSSFAMGDGTTVRCARTQAWTKRVQPNQPSPVCGHRYRQPSEKGADYTVTATDHWEVRWAALGQTGIIELDPTTTGTLPVVELHAVTR